MSAGETQSDVIPSFHTNLRCPSTWILYPMRVGTQSVVRAQRVPEAVISTVLTRPCLSESNVAVSSAITARRSVDILDGRPPPRGMACDDHFEEVGCFSAASVSSHFRPNRFVGNSRIVASARGENPRRRIRQLMARYECVSPARATSEFSPSTVACSPDASYDDERAYVQGCRLSGHLAGFVLAVDTLMTARPFLF